MTDNSNTHTTTTTRRRSGASLRRLLALLRPHVGRLIIAGILLMITSGLGLIFPLVIGRFLNTILAQHTDSFLNTIAVALFILFVFQAALGALQGYILTSIGERLSA